MVKRKPVIIPTQGQLPIYGGVTGPILSPCYIDIDSIRTMVAMRIDVSEVMLDSEGKYLLDNNNKLITVPLDLNNYDKDNFVKEQEIPSTPVATTTPTPVAPEVKEETPVVEEKVEVKQEVKNNQKNNNQGQKKNNQKN